MKAYLKDRQIIAENTIQATFETEIPVDFKAGQFIQLMLIDPPYKDDKGPERYFSIINTPNSNKEISIATRLRDSAFKRSLNELPVGTPVEIKMIGGSFCLPNDYENNLIFITGGIGITPFLSMLRYANENNLDHKITLFYFNKTKETTAFLEELKQLTEENKNFNLHLIMTEDNSWEGEKGMFNSEMIQKNFPEYKNNIYMVAGPPKMVQDIAQILTDLGIVNENIITENFTGY